MDETAGSVAGNASSCMLTSIQWLSTSHQDPQVPSTQSVLSCLVAVSLPLDQPLIFPLTGSKLYFLFLWEPFG